MELKNTTIDAGSLTVYNSDFINATIDTFDESLNSQTALKYFLLLKDELLKANKTEEAANEFKKLQHQYKDFDASPNEVVLPKTKIEFPRFQKFELDKSQTKWEKFAKERGIQKIKKRSRLVWSEEVKDWVPRWGSKSANHIKEDLDIIREVKKNNNPYEDPFALSKSEKKMKIAKQKVREMHNKIRNAGLKPSDFGGDAGDAHKEHPAKDAKRQPKTRESEVKKKGFANERKKKIEKKLNLSKVATGSMGKYKGNTDQLDKKTKRIRQKTLPDIKNTKEEKRRNEEFLKRVLSK